MTTSHHSFFAGRMPFLPPNQQRQSTEGNAVGGRELTVSAVNGGCFLLGT